MLEDWLNRQDGGSVEERVGKIEHSFLGSLWCEEHDGEDYTYKSLQPREQCERLDETCLKNVSKPERNLELLRRYERLSLKGCYKSINKIIWSRLKCISNSFADR